MDFYMAWKRRAYRKIVDPEVKQYAGLWRDAFMHKRENDELSKSKAKGTGYENEVRDMLVEAIGNAYRCGEIVGHPGDVSFTLKEKTAFVGEPARETERKFFIECKRRGDAWNELYKWLEGTAVKGEKQPNDFLTLRADKKRTLIVMDFEHFASLLNGVIPEPKRG